MKKTYTKPQMEVIKLQQSKMLCVSDVQNNADLLWQMGGIVDGDDN